MSARTIDKGWRHAARLAPEDILALPFAGEHIAIAGIGAAGAIARAYAALREDAGHGMTDGGEPDEIPRRRYARTLLLSRTGDEAATIELLEWLRSEAILAIAVGAPAGSPVHELAGVTVPIADVEVPGGDDAGFAATAFAVLRHHLVGVTAGGDAARALRTTLPDVSGVRRWVFVGHRWTLGIAEAAARGFRAKGAEALAGSVSELAAGSLGRLDAATLVWWFDRSDVTLASTGRSGVSPAATGRSGVSPAVTSSAASRVGNLDPAAELVLALRVAETALPAHARSGSSIS